MTQFKKAQWIEEEFYIEKRALNVFHKETEPFSYSHDESLKNRHFMVRKTFTLPRFKEAKLLISADDFYKLYINGEYVGEGPAQNYYLHYYYNEIDVTRFLKPGDNVIGADVYYQGLINRVYNSGDYRQGIIAELLIDGKPLVYTDQSWRTHAYSFTGMTMGYDTQFTEQLDYRVYDSKWKNPEFDDRLWDGAIVNPHDDHTFILQDTPLVTRYELKPETVRNIGDDRYFIDFGQEITGVFTLTATGKSGEVIEVRCGEELEDGFVRYKLRCNCLYQDFYTLSGENEEVLEGYEYKGFRYVEVLGAGVNPKTFRAYVRHYPFDDENALLSSSNRMLNRVFEMCKNTIKYGAQEVYVDCPTREKGQYLGDLTITGLSHLYLANDLRLFKKALENFRDFQIICPGLMAVAPGSLMQEIADYSLQFPLQVLTFYKHSGDLDFLREMSSACDQVMAYFENYQRSDGLLESVTEKWNLVDWPEEARDHYDFPLTRPVTKGCHNVINAFFYGALQAVYEIKDILKQHYENKLPNLRAAFNQAFFNPETGLYVDTEHSRHSSVHSNMLPVLFSLVEGRETKKVVEFLKAKRFSCGVYMAYFYLKALCKAGEIPFVFDLLTKDDLHSWVNMLKEGATTTFEAWGKDQKWNTSLLHPWATSPVIILIEDLLGISFDPGYENIKTDVKLSGLVDSLNFTLGLGKKRIKIIIEHEQINSELRSEQDENN